VSGILYVIATPIGNLEDMTYRAVRLMQEVSLIAAEDTRHSRKLLDHYAIRTPLISYHEHNEGARAEQLVGKLLDGDSLGLISDAGTPCIADPGYRLVSRCRQEGIEVVAVPGASAVIAALSIAGLATDSFRFIGFLPSKAHGRGKVLQELTEEKQTTVCYESPHRLVACLEQVIDICGADRPLAIARELTKRHEELYYGCAADALKHFSSGSVKGEIVLLLGPAPERKRAGSVREALEDLRHNTELSWKEIVKQVAKEFGLPGSDVYKESLELRDHH